MFSWIAFHPSAAPLTHPNNTSNVFYSSEDTHTLRSHLQCKVYMTWTGADIWPVNIEYSICFLKILVFFLKLFAA